jgi:hypothetical protein
MILNLKKFHLWLFLLFCLLNIDLFSTDRPLLLIGTNGKGAEGIYRVNFSESSGRSSPLVLAAKIGSPNFLALHPHKNILVVFHPAANSLWCQTSALIKLLPTKSEGTAQN